MLPDPLAGCYAKLCGANEQKLTLEKQWEAFLDREPYAITFQSRSETPRHITVVADRIDPPPLELSVTLGHIVHDLRSALDQLVCRFRDPYSTRDGLPNAFPIYVSRPDFERDLVGNKPPRRLLEGIDPRSDAWALIEQAQPYQSGADAESHPLWVLQLLSNRDKHRTLNAALGYPDPAALQRAIVWDPPPTIPIKAPRYKPLPVEMVVSQTALAEFWFDPTGPIPDMYVDGQLPFQPAFSYGGGIATCQTLQALAQAVQTVLDTARSILTRR